MVYKIAEEFAQKYQTIILLSYLVGVIIITRLMLGPIHEEKENK